MLQRILSATGTATVNQNAFSPHAEAPHGLLERVWGRDKGERLAQGLEHRQ